MASSPPASGEAGYATPAAVVISLALAIVATAVSNRSLAALELARADFARAQADGVLAGVQQAAALTVAQTPRAEPLAWTVPADTGTVSVLAEPEAPKLSLAAASDLDDASLARLGVRDPDALRARLKTLALNAGDDVDIGNADAASLWAACARTFISQDGAASVARAIAPQRLGGGGSGSGRLGEVWRVRTASSGGWVDERTVRFSGDLTHPARVIRRHLFKAKGGGERCASVFG